MSDRTLRRQDEATSSLGIFREAVRIEADLDGLGTDEAYAVLAALAAEHGVPACEYEILQECPNHPETSVVDCLECDPE